MCSGATTFPGTKKRWPEVGRWSRSSVTVGVQDIGGQRRRPADVEFQVVEARLELVHVLLEDGLPVVEVVVRPTGHVLLGRLVASVDLLHDCHPVDDHQKDGKKKYVLN